MTDIEAAAEVATGAIIARAVEPTHGADDGHTHESACLNCAAPLTGPYCAACGQQAHVHRTLTALWHDIAHGVFHFEGKVWRTLPMLAWRPGEVTRRYIHGERARFVSPLALFLFSVFLMFAVFESVGGPIASGTADGQIETGDASNARTEMAAELERARAKVASIEGQRRAAIAQGKSTDAINTKLAEARADIRALSVPVVLAGGTSEALGTGLKIDTGSAVFDNRVRKALENPSLILYKMQSSAYKFAWALIPISLPFMWAMFAWRREYRIYDHAIFVTYSLSSVLLLLVVMALIAAVGGPTELLLFLIPVHFYRQLKQAYSLSIGAAVWRTALLVATASLVLIVFATLLLALGLSG